MAGAGCWASTALEESTSIVTRPGVNRDIQERLSWLPAGRETRNRLGNAGGNPNFFIHTLWMAWGEFGLRPEEPSRGRGAD